MYINVKPEEMNTVASNIENKISEWQAAVQKLYTLQQEMDGMLCGMVPLMTASTKIFREIYRSSMH